MRIVEINPVTEIGRAAIDRVRLTLGNMADGARDDATTGQVTDEDMAQT